MLTLIKITSGRDFHFKGTTLPPVAQNLDFTELVFEINVGLMNRDIPDSRRPDHL